MLKITQAMVFFGKYYLQQENVPADFPFSSISWGPRQTKWTSFMLFESYCHCGWSLLFKTTPSLNHNEILEAFTFMFLMLLSTKNGFAQDFSWPIGMLPCISSSQLFEYLVAGGFSECPFSEGHFSESQFSGRTFLWIDFSLNFQNIWLFKGHLRWAYFLQGALPLEPPHL